MKFVTIDFETANRNRSSPCEVGITMVENGALVETRSWLIKPQPFKFDYFNTSIHGITQSMLENEPEFDAIWNELHPLLEGQFIIAHNAGFDISVLRATLDQYGIAYPNFEYTCSYLFSKRVWPQNLSYGLHTLCNMQGIALEHHRAASDSRATAELCLKAFEISGIRTYEDITNILQLGIGRVTPGQHIPSRTKRTRLFEQADARNVVGDPAKHDEDSIFYGSTVVFTGALSSMTRGEAQQLVADIGGVVANGVTKATNFLVVGQQDVKLVGDDGMSGKEEKAFRMRAQGHSIEVMSEADFLANVEGGTSLAMKLALKFTDAENIPARFRRGNSSGNIGKRSDGVESRFQREVRIWESVVQSITEHVGAETAERYLNSMPHVPPECRSLSECLDFTAFNDYVHRRRDVELCCDEELGALALLLTELQRMVERRIK